MFCNKENVNILTAHLLAAGIEDAVVCPGSRNAVIVHNFNECAQRSNAANAPTMRLHPVTDERSAAFVAIGLWLATRKPIVVCVTSGSALLNLLPGVCEAYYRHIPLILISADRPAEWIGQLDGQTLPQPNALLPYAKCWNLPDDAQGAKIHTLCHEALHATRANGGNPIHINVPLHEPLFTFNTPHLPEVSTVPTDDSATPTAPSVTPTYACVTLVAASAKAPVPVASAASAALPPALLTALRSAQHPAIIIGQWEEAAVPAITTLQSLGWTIFAENISNHNIYCDTLPAEGIDLLVHIGGALVEKRLKLQLRTLPNLIVVRIDETDECPTTFGHVEYKVKAHPAIALEHIDDYLRTSVERAEEVERHASHEPSPHVLAESATEALCLHHSLSALFVGNSTAVRWANKHLRLQVPTYCNRGVNGIEGSLSVAAGYSLQAQGTTLCLIGDLSFFYDANALWNQHLNGRLRILLINNKRGGIFYRLPHLDESPALDDYIAAHHNSDASGIAQSYRCTYLSASSSNLETDINTLLTRLLDEPSERPVILEVTINKP